MIVNISGICEPFSEEIQVLVMIVNISGICEPFSEEIDFFQKTIITTQNKAGKGEACI